jgi:hypothetical protein
MPVKKETEKRSFTGYPTDEGCFICGKKPAKIEPRFGFIRCKEHSEVKHSEIENKNTD